METRLCKKGGSAYMGFVLSLFLYFPEDKTEYIPAAFNMAIFLLMAVLVFRMIIRLSKKEEREVNEKYKHMNDEEQ